jgi:hypothetical protein
MTTRHASTTFHPPVTHHPSAFSHHSRHHITHGWSIAPLPASHYTLATLTCCPLLHITTLAHSHTIERCMRAGLPREHDAGAVAERALGGQSAVAQHARQPAVDTAVARAVRAGGGPTVTTTRARREPPCRREGRPPCAALRRRVRESHRVRKKRAYHALRRPCTALRSCVLDVCVWLAG